MSEGNYRTRQVEKICDLLDDYIGSTYPIGDSYVDKERLSNLKCWEQLVSHTLDKIVDASTNESNEGSVRNIRNYASSVLGTIRDDVDNALTALRFTRKC